MGAKNTIPLNKVAVAKPLDKEQLVKYRDLIRARDAMHAQMEYHRSLINEAIQSFEQDAWYIRHLREKINSIKCSPIDEIKKIRMIRLIEQEIQDTGNIDTAQRMHMADAMRQLAGFRDRIEKINAKIAAIELLMF